MQRPSPMSSLVKGMDGEIDRSVSVRQQLTFGARQDIGDVLAISTPDTSFVIKLLISLFALLFSLNCVTREKEEGTLQALLAHSVRRGELILGKAIGVTVSLLAPFAVACLIEIVYLMTAHRMFGNKDEVSRTLLIFAMGALYGVVFVLIGLFVSTAASHTRTAVVVALLVWCTIVLVLPNAAVLAANLVSPAPSYNHLKALLRESRERILESERRAHPGAKSLLELPNSKEVQFRTFDADRQLMDGYMDRKLTQLFRAQLLAVLSPAGALSFGHSNLAGTGTGDYMAYLEMYRSERDRMIDALQRRWDLPQKEGNKLVQEALEGVAGLQRNSNSLRASLWSSMGSFASLGIWGMVFAFATHRQFRKYDVS